MVGDVGPRSDDVQLDVVAARRYVADHLRTTGAAARFPGLTWSVAAVGESVVVRVRGPLVLPLRLPGSEGDVLVSATSAAVVHVTD